MYAAVWASALSALLLLLVLTSSRIATAYLTSLQAHTDTVYCLSVSPDGTALASSGFDGVTKIWTPPAPEGKAARTAASDRV